MSEIQNALKPIVRRTPVAPFVHPLRGSVNYRWSVLRAPLFPSSEGGFVPGSLVKLALFLQDVPVILSADSGYAKSDYVTVMPPLNFVEPTLGLVNSLGTTGDLQSVADVAAGEVSRVRLLTTGLTVAAYAAVLRVQNRELLDNEDPLSCSLYLSAIAESGVVAGVPSFLRTADNSVFAPVILPSSQYTQEIRDNDNVVQLGVTRYTVVGVHEEVLPTP